MAWQHFASLIETAVGTTLSGDADVTALAPALIEAEPPQADEGPPELWRSKVPYIGYRVTSGEADAFATRALMLRYRLRVRIVTQEHTAADAYAANAQLRDAVARAIRAVNGTATWLSSGHHVLIESWEASMPESDDDDPYLFESQVTMTISVIYPEE